MTSRLWIIILIGTGVYLMRAGSLVLGGRIKWSERTKEWSSYISPAVLGGLLGPLLLLQNGRWIPLADNPMLIAALPTILIAWWSRRLLLTVASGVGFYAVVFYLLGLGG